MKTLKDKFKTYDNLRNELCNLCNDYIKTHNIRKDNNDEFSDFMLNDNEIHLFFVDEECEPCLTYKSVTIKELEEFNKDNEDINYIITNLLTGRYLLDTCKISSKQHEYYNMYNEFCTVLSKIENNEQLSEREKYLIRLGSNQFYENIKDMCEQLNVNYENLIKLYYV